MQGEFLVVTVDRLLAVDREGPTRLTVLTEAEFDLRVTVLVERSEGDTALCAVKFDVLELWENASPAGDHARDAEQGVQVVLTKLAQGERDRQVAHADVKL